MNAAKRFLVERVRAYSGLTEAQLKITRLRILAWITAGSKKVRVCHIRGFWDAQN